jgi:hypothetical protein
MSSSITIDPTYVGTPDIPLIRNMTILLPALAVAFAAFCIWLTVRMVNRRERWAKWTLVAMLVLPALYVASFGPACWWFPDRVQFGIASADGEIISNDFDCRAPQIYWPIGWLADRAPPVHSAVSWFSGLGTDESIRLPTNPTGEHWIRN